MTFDLYGTPAPRKPTAPPSIDQRIARATWQQNGGLWVIRVPDVCEYLNHDDKHGDEFICCEVGFEDGNWLARCWHEDRDDPANDHDLGVADQSAAKAEALEVLRTYMQDWKARPKPTMPTGNMIGMSARWKVRNEDRGPRNLPAAARSYILREGGPDGASSGHGHA